MQTCLDKYPVRQPTSTDAQCWMNYWYICRVISHTSVIIWQSIYRRFILIEPEGTYLLWMDFREYGLSPEALNAQILKDARIWFNEGSMFGPEGAGFMRINIASPRGMIIETMERLGEVFGE